MKRYLTLSILMGLLIVACSKDDDDEPMTGCDTENITYTNTVSDIFNMNCTFSGCHSSGSVNGSLATYDDAVNFVQNRPIIMALRREPGVEPMPRNMDKLPSCTIDKIEAWINDGTPE
ncbi:MAG: hypothetical protein R3275_01950 [Saprospiraceae bacterium]|nr:hypothetical protein [Saprospiraceae bacterium]